MEKEVATIVDINVTAFIPEDWVGSAGQKMIEYKRLADEKMTWNSITSPRSGKTASPNRLKVSKT